MLDGPLLWGREEPEPKLVLVVPGWLIEVVMDRLVVRELDHSAVQIGDRDGVALAPGDHLAQSIDQGRGMAGPSDQKSMALLVQSSSSSRVTAPFGEVARGLGGAGVRRGHVLDDLVELLKLG